MGILRNIHRGQKDVDKLLKEDFDNRARAFEKEYILLVNKYRCVHRSIMDFKNEGSGGIVPKIVIIDATKALEQEKELNEKKLKEKNEKEQEKQKI